MKKLILLALALPAIVFAQTYPSPTFNSLTLQTPLAVSSGGTGTTTSTGTGSIVRGTSPTISNPTITGGFTATGLVTLPSLAAQAANTVVANVTGSSASPSAFAMPNCSSSTSALQWTSGTGFVCGSSFANLSGATFTGQLGVSYNNASFVLNDAAGAGFPAIFFNKTGSNVWAFANNSSTGLFGLNRYVSGTLVDVPITVSNSTGLVTFADGISSNSSSNAITGGAINNATIGATTPSTGAFTTLSASTSNPSLNYLATGTGAVARSYASKFGDIVSVTDFGADPTGTADSTTAINNAIAAVTPLGGTVYLPGGTYKISSAIVLPNTNASVNFIGAGLGTKIVNSTGTSFDMITWANPGSGNMIQTYAIVGNFQISQSGAVGSGAEINTQYASSLTLKDILLAGLATTGDGIKIVGNGSIASHDIHISGITGTSTTGNAVIHMTSTTNDIKVSNIIFEGQFLVKYGFLLDNGLGTVQIQDVHISNFATNVFSSGTNTGPIQCTNCLFDSASNDNTVLNGTTNSAFVNSRFMVAGSTYSSVLLTNASNNQFTNCIFDSGGTAKYAINETGTSNGNRFNQVTTIGSFSTGAASLVGNDTSVRVSGQDLVIGGNGSITAGTTLYFGSGPANATEANVQFAVPYGGYIRKVLIQSTNAPGSGQTYTATVRQNNSNTSLTAQISGTSSFNAQGSGFLFMNEGDQIDVSVAASASAAASNIRVTLVVNY